MSNQIKMLISAEIPELFEDLDLLRSITQYLDTYMDDFKKLINLNDLGDWKLLIWINLRNTNGIGIFKRAKRFPSDKEFEISISITVPNSDEAHYGISDMTGFYLPLNNKNFYVLHPYFSEYDDLYHYIIESAKRAIDTAFTYKTSTGNMSLSKGAYYGVETEVAFGTRPVPIK